MNSSMASCGEKHAASPPFVGSPPCWIRTRTNGPKAIHSHAVGNLSCLGPIREGRQYVRTALPDLACRCPILGYLDLCSAVAPCASKAIFELERRLRRESKIQKLSQKEASDGPRAIVTVEHALYAEETSRPVLTETQTYIMLSARPGASKVNDPGDVASLATMKRIVPDETLLFHYSALGFNSHRIHLDRDFARQTEGFPDLVVNGGLATLLLTELLRNELRGALTVTSGQACRAVVLRSAHLPGGGPAGKQVAVARVR